MLHYNPRHVSSINMPIFRAALQSALIRHSVQPFTESDDTRCCDIQFVLLKMGMLMLETCRGL